MNTATKRQFEGIVTSTKMAKTAVVRVDSARLHARYGKRYTTSKKFKVHDEGAVAKVGDRVRFEECRPISKDKRWRLLEVTVRGVEKASLVDENATEAAQA